MDLLDALRPCRTDIAWDRHVRLVRHADAKRDLELLLPGGLFGVYQAPQSRLVFGTIPWTVTMLG